MMLSECINDYKNDCYGLAHSTAKLYTTHLNRLVEVVGDVAMEQWEAPSALRKFMAGLRCKDGRPYSKFYLHQVYRTLNTFFRWVVREEIWDANPMVRVRRPRLPKRKSPRLTFAEIECLLDAVVQTSPSARNLAIVCLMLDSGLRRKEIVEL